MKVRFENYTDDCSGSVMLIEEGNVGVIRKGQLPKLISQVMQRPVKL